MEIDAVLEVEAGDPQIAIDFLVANINLSKSRLKDLMNKGGVWRVDKNGDRQRLRRAMTDILVGEQIEIFYDDDLLALKPLKAELLEDAGQYSVWNKPAGMPLHGSDWGDFQSFARAVELAFNPAREIFWLAALDYEASGLLILAHTRKAALAFSNQLAVDGFEGASLHYRADVQGDLGAVDRLDQPIDGATAITRVKKARYDARPNRSVVDLWPETGREHQIVRQFAAAGNPVVGDERYRQEDDSVEGLRLRLVELAYSCPVSGEARTFSLIHE
ncbi:pseudouridine synthase family protein [Reinekea marinisedimentorum]|uniref:tRNA pseudouridine32 synthase / 23S rRNA pseudouridine746 synthase n=1 Tax=Reinekea marinisedimentorum TaxID=230495 RepID=A0A4R3I347_9GAMM|nr:RNA pseudouridine synthase [Reinekea marinisedimentorum]TCS40002.1 tRNA pseudouridine32 synthase / 23S rRNA pseudouridine746 synthase [Reinekea marinisedimentorum]